MLIGRDKVKTFKAKLKVTSKEMEKSLQMASSFYRKVYNTCLNEQELRIIYAAGQTNLYFFEKEEMYKMVKKVKLGYFPYANNFDGGILKSAVYNAVEAFVLSMKKDWHMQNIKHLSRKKSNMKFRTMSKVKITSSYIVLPKIGKIKLYEKGYLPTSGIFEEVSIVHDGNDWFAVVSVKDDNPRSLAWRGLNTYEKLVNTFNNEDITLLDNNKEKLVVNGEEIEDVTCSKRYLKVEKKYKLLKKKLIRQTKNNQKADTRTVSYVPVTTRNKIKTRKELAKVSTRLENIKRDFFKKTAHAIVKKQMAITKPHALCVLDPLSLSQNRGYLRTRHQKRAGTGHFYNVLKRKFEYNGAEVYYLSYPEYQATLGSRGCKACGDTNESHSSVQKLVSMKQELPFGKEQMDIKTSNRGTLTLENKEE